MKSDEVLQAFFEFFSWLYEVQIAPDQEREIEELLRAGWTNSDDSEQELVDYVVRLHLAVRKAPELALEPLRKTLRDYFKAELTMVALNDRSRVLTGVCRAIESLRPGATGGTLQEATKPDAWLELQHRTLVPTRRSASGGHGGPRKHAAEYELDAVEQDDPFVIQEREMRRAQAATLRSNIAKMRHDTLMSIIGKIG